MKRIMITKFLACTIFAFCSCALFAADKTYNAFKVKVTGHGQPVILLPDENCSGQVWDETVAHLAGDHECHVLTFAGSADAPPLANAPYFETYKNQVEQYIVDKHLDHAILIGHGMGGVICLWIASEMNVFLQKMVIIDAMPFAAAVQNPDAKGQHIEAQAQSMWATYKTMNDTMFSKSRLSMAQYMCNNPGKWEMIAGWGKESDKKTMAYTSIEMNGKDLRQDIQKIKVPVLILGGYNVEPPYPSAAPRESLVKAYAGQYESCKKCTVHIAENGAKHFIMYDAPDWYFKEMDGFLEIPCI